jgi:hypothetical protein
VQLDVEDNPAITSGYTMRFEFGPNNFFTDQLLTKKYTFRQDLPVIVEASVPNWKPGQVNLMSLAFSAYYRGL